MEFKQENSFAKVLESLGTRTELHAKFLNTLSLLEYIGTRKIVKSQVDRALTFELMGHIAEEIRHAQILKSLALKLSNDALVTYEEGYLLCGNAGRRYIQTVDHQVEKHLARPDAELNYLLTTLLVEERAAVVYPLYEEHLTRLGYQGKLKSIIRDEDKHLQTVLEDLKKVGIQSDELLTRLRAIESQAFEEFMTEVLSATEKV